MHEAVLLMLDDGPAGGIGSSCGRADAGSGLRAPLLACRDALSAGGLKVDIVVAYSDAEIDAALDRLPGARLVVGAATDGQLRAVVRRMLRRYSPAPSKRPADLPADRTVPDLPPIGVLPLGPPAGHDLVSRLRLPQDPAAVAAAVLDGGVRRLDLLRNDGGSVTLHGTLLGSTDDRGSAVPFAAQIWVDDAVLADGSESLLAVAVANADGYASPDGLPLAANADPSDGVLDVAVALPVIARDRFGRRRSRMEVRRARGRAVAVTPAAEVAFTDDGVAGALTHKRSWWMERAAWAVYTPT